MWRTGSLWVWVTNNRYCCELTTGAINSPASNSARKRLGTNIRGLSHTEKTLLRSLDPILYQCEKRYMGNKYLMVTMSIMVLVLVSIVLAMGDH